MPGAAHRGGLKPFQYPTSRPRPARQQVTLPRVEPGEGETITPVQGITPDSVQEWRLAMALEGDHIRFLFQYPLWGGAGGVVNGYSLDFLVLNPFKIAVPVLGSYYHSTIMDPNLDFVMSRLAHEFGFNNVRPVWEWELPDKDAARRWVREHL